MESIAAADIHPDLRFTRLGAVLRRVANEGEAVHGDTLPSLARAAVLQSHDAPMATLPLDVIADYMDDNPDHPLADRFNWRGASHGLNLDRNLAAVAAGERHPNGWLYRVANGINHHSVDFWHTNDAVNRLIDQGDLPNVTHEAVAKSARRLMMKTDRTDAAARSAADGHDPLLFADGTHHELADPGRFADHHHYHAPDHPERYAHDPIRAAAVRLARPQYGPEPGTPTTRWVDHAAPADAPAVVAHPGVLFPRVKAGTAAPTLRPDLTVTAGSEDTAHQDANARHHRERAAFYHGLRAAGLPGGGGQAGQELLDYVQTLARHALGSDPEWADRYRTAAARLAADSVPMHQMTAVGGVVRDLIRKHLPARGEGWVHPGDPGLLARVQRVKDATAPQHLREPVAPPRGPAADADPGLFPLAELPAGDLPPLPLAKRPPKLGSPLTPAVERRLGTAGDLQLVDDEPVLVPHDQPMIPPADDALPPLPLAPTPRKKAGTPFDPKPRRQFIADRLAAHQTPDQIAESLAHEFGMSPAEAHAAVRRFRGLARKPQGRYDPPIALARLREAVERLARKRTKRECRNKKCKRPFMSVGPHHVYCSPNCRVSRADGYRDGFTRGRKREAAKKVMVAEAAADAPAQMSRLAARVARLRRAGSPIRKAAVPETVAALFRTARENPYETTPHLVLADAIDDHYHTPLSALIRGRFAPGGEIEPVPENNWYEPVENSWDGTFPYTARVGESGPFKLYLGHEGSPEQTQRWVLHAVSTARGSRDFGYTFEFDHDEAQKLPEMFPDTAIKRHITGHPRDWEEFAANMDEEERNRP